MTRPFILLLVVIAIIITAAIVFHPAFCGFLSIPLIILIIDGISSDFYQSSLYCNIINTFNVKRVYTTYGRFYIIANNRDHIILYRDRFFYLQHINTKYFSDIAQLKGWIKEEVDKIYRVKESKSRVRNELKMWNGCVDKETEREKKLTDIL